MIPPMTFFAEDPSVRCSSLAHKTIGGIRTNQGLRRGKPDKSLDSEGKTIKASPGMQVGAAETAEMTKFRARGRSGRRRHDVSRSRVARYSGAIGEMTTNVPQRKPSRILPSAITSSKLI
jgi:hypothetical protein